MSNMSLKLKNSINISIISTYVPRDGRIVLTEWPYIALKEVRDWVVNTEHDLQEEVFFQFLVFSENLNFTQ